MIDKVYALLKNIWYRIKFRKKIQVSGLSFFERKTSVNIKSGSMKVGSNLHLRTGSYIAVVKGGRLSLGDGVFINRNCSIVCQDLITIGNNCKFGPNVILYDHDHRFGTEGIKDGYKTSPIVIEDNCWLGAGVIILRGTYIGAGSVIGAGTVVKGEIPPRSLVTCQGNRNLSIAPIEDR